MVQSGSAACLKIQAPVGKYLEKNTFWVLTQKISKEKNVNLNVIMVSVDVSII